MAEQLAPAEFAPAVRPIRVIVIDETLAARALAGLLATAPDLDVVAVASTPQEATAIAAEERPDVILTSLELPSGSAFDVVRLVAEASPVTKVVVIASRPDTSFVITAFRAGCAGFLTRRQSPEDVVRAIRTAHAGDLPIDPLILREILTRGGPRHDGPAPDLTERERSVLALLSEGLTHADIAKVLHVSVNTVRNHAQRLLQKLGAHSRFEAVIVARRRGLLET